jgi:hypothetical protein
VVATICLFLFESRTKLLLTDVCYAKKILHLADIHYARRVLLQIETKRSNVAESEIEKRAVIKVLLFSTWLHRLYFIIRAALMAVISAVVTFLFILSLGTINAFTGIVFGVFVFGLSLLITRLFDLQLNQITKKIVEIMASHRTVRDFIMNHF